MNDSSREAFRQWAEPRREAVKGRSPQEQWIWSQAWEEAWFAREAQLSYELSTIKAEAATMRRALEEIVELSEGVPDPTREIEIAERALASPAGRDLLELVQKLMGVVDFTISELWREQNDSDDSPSNEFKCWIRKLEEALAHAQKLGFTRPD
jgi:hypothetical protein